MSRCSQRLADYLAHMLQAIERIARYTKSLDEVAFLQDELVQDAEMRNSSQRHVSPTAGA